MKIKMKNNFRMGLIFIVLFFLGCSNNEQDISNFSNRNFNDVYTGKNLDRVAFPIGGIGAGMVCLEGTGAISHVSVYNKPDIHNEPWIFAAITVKDLKNGAKILEGPVPDWKIFGLPRKSLGASRTGYGLPRFDHAGFLARFPFATVNLQDNDIPLNILITGWSPFIPSDADNSSLPCGALEYKFVNNGNVAVDAVFSFNTVNFMRQPECTNSIHPIKNGFILSNEGGDQNLHLNGDFAFFTTDNETKVDHCWYRGGHFDTETMAWNNVEKGNFHEVAPVKKNAPGASLFVPVVLKPGEEKTIKVLFSWYVPDSDLRTGKDQESQTGEECDSATGCCEAANYKPWYSSRFRSIIDVASYWLLNYEMLKEYSELFKESFYNTTLPDEVLEAISANLSILKSPTVLRQHDGRLWAWEGCNDAVGCCAGSCTHVWNYAQAIPHLFPSLERSLRETEFNESQNEIGRQIFRSGLPIRVVVHDYFAAADGQLGGIMKFYRDWRISGDDEWMRKMFPLVKQSMEFSINHWDPRKIGILEEPQHNTYDIEFWGPNGMCTSFYLGALQAIILMGNYLGEDTDQYQELLDKGVNIIESELFNGEYFFQKVQVDGLDAKSPVEIQLKANSSPEELKELLINEGTKYQYGEGCLSDGILGMWLAKVCGIDDAIVSTEKVHSHLESVYKYNYFSDLSDHANPQRPGYAMKNDGGLILCTWPHGGKHSLPFVYSDEVWTGVEYQVASHLMFLGKVSEGLEIVQSVRNRYDGRVRNPFNEYECGHFYARALSSYALIQGLTGIRYDAIEKTLYIDSKIGDDFTSFFAADGGWGNIGLKNGKPFVELKYGTIDIQRVFVSGRKSELF
jgi:uncharacterized protein (DUF608 family)